MPWFLGGPQSVPPSHNALTDFEATARSFGDHLVGRAL